MLLVVFVRAPLYCWCWLPLLHVLLVVVVLAPFIVVVVVVIVPASLQLVVVVVALFVVGGGCLAPFVVVRWLRLASFIVGCACAL